MLVKNCFLSVEEERILEKFFEEYGGYEATIIEDIINRLLIVVEDDL